MYYDTCLIRQLLVDKLVAHCLIASFFYNMPSRYGCPHSRKCYIRTPDFSACLPCTLRCNPLVPLISVVSVLFYWYPGYAQSNRGKH